MKKKPLYEYQPVPGVFSLQVDVPHRDYGACDYFIPAVMNDWLQKQGLDARWVGCQSNGDGYTNGITNKESCYLIKDAKKEDGFAFQLLFPRVRVHIHQQYEHR